MSTVVSVVRPSSRRGLFFGALGLTAILAGYGAVHMVQGSLIPSTAAQAGWSDDVGLIQGRLRTMLPGAAGPWSLPVTEGGRKFRIIWLDRDDKAVQLRAYVDSDGHVSSLSIADTVGSGREPADASALVDAAIPAASASDRAQLAAALVGLVKAEGQGATVRSNGVDFRASSGVLHFTLSATPRK